MLDFSELTDEEAFAYRDAYAAAVPARRQWLAAELARAGHPTTVLDGPAYLDELWAWYAARFDAAGAQQLQLRTPQPSSDPQPGLRPPWHPDPSSYFSDDGLWLIDLVGIHWGTLAIQAIPGAEWTVSTYPGTKRGVDINYRRTMIISPGKAEFDPVGPVYGITLSHFLRNGSWDRYGGLPGLYKHNVERAQHGHS